MSDENHEVRVFPLELSSRQDNGRRMADLNARLSEAVIATALDSIVVINQAGFIVGFNGAAEALFGHTAADVVGQPMSDILIPPDLRAAHHSGLKRYLDTGEERVIGQRVEVPALRADGQTITVELTVAPVPFGDELYFTAYIRDLTTLKENEAALKASETRYSELFHNSVDAIIIHDLDGRIHDVNQQAEALLGMTREALLDTPIPALHPPEALEKAKAGFATVRETGVLRMEIPFLHACGVQIPTEVNAKVFETPEGPLIQGIVRDQTEKARVEAERARYQRLLSSAERMAQLGSWRFDMATEDVLISKALYDLLGRDPDQPLTGPELMAIIHGEDREKMNALTERAIKTGEGYDVEFRILRSDGQEIITRSICQTESEMVEVDGRTVRRTTGLFGSLQNVTQARRAENALKAAKKAAEQASEAKTAFLANMSHEMRTPLNGILGALQLIDQDHLSEDDRARLATAHRSAESAVTLVNDILDISRIEAGEIAIETAPFSPVDLITQTEELFGPSAGEKGLQLILNNEDLPAELIGDAGRIRQVLFNLVSNALKFTDTGSITVTARAELDSEQSSLSFEVVDTGSGVPEDKLAVLFDRFQQADSSVSRAHGGVGLGLAISRDLVLCMDGQINLENRLEGGVRAWFTIPVSQFVLNGPAHQPRSTRLDKLTGHVLLVEDSVTNAAVAQDMLERFGLTVDVASNGEQALKTALGRPYDLVLMDIAMPVMDGLTASRALREAGFDRPILALTAHALATSRDEAFKAGMDGFLTKPLNITSLNRALAGWLPQSLDMLDFEAINTQWGGMADAYGRIAALFKDEAQTRRQAMETAINTDDYDSLALNAHAVKGGAENLGAMVLRDAARQLEVLGKAQASLEEINHAFAAFSDCLELTLEALDRKVSP